MPNSSAAINRGGKPEQGPFYVLDGQLLSAAGAVFKPAAYTLIPPEARRLSLVATYVADAAAAPSGQVKARILWQVAGAEEGKVADVYDAVLDGTTVVKSTSYLSNPLYAYEIIGPPVAAGATLSFRLYEVSVPVAVVGVTVEVFEVGDTAHPGMVTLRAYTSDRV